MSLEQVQRVTNQTLNVKYRAELASQDYKQEVEKMNEYLNVMRSDFKPLLRRIQQAEE
jgi:CBS-domain-containing membrane protein